MWVLVLLPAVSSSRLVSVAGVRRYQTFGHPDVYGSSGAPVASLTSSVSVNGSAVTTVALSKSSFGGGAARAGAAAGRRKRTRRARPAVALDPLESSETCRRQSSTEVSKPLAGDCGRKLEPEANREPVRRGEELQ